MEYIVLGLLVSIGWHLGKLICMVLDEVLHARLHKAEWYKIVLGTKSIKSKSGTNGVKMKIGFE